MAHPNPKKLLATPASQLVEYHLTDETQALMKQAYTEIKDKFIEEPSITVFNKECKQPRDIYFGSNEAKGYFYSGQCAEAQPLTPVSALLLDAANKICATALGPAQFNAILVNRYKNGKKNVGKHSDSEHGLDKRAGVFAMSYGATRKFRIRRKTGNAIAGDFPARHGYAFQMRGEFQKEFTHEIPKELKIEEERVSFTFRKHDPIVEQQLWDEWTVKKMMDQQRQDGERMAAEHAERAKRKREEEEQALWGAMDAAKALADEEQQGAVPPSPPPPHPPPAPEEQQEEKKEEKNLFGGKNRADDDPNFGWDEERDGPEPSGCLAAGWGRPICQSPSKRQKQ